MTFITRKQLSRRTMLRGAGAAIALPFLDSMVPAFAATTKAPTRLAFFYVPNGIIMKDWTPAEVGALPAQLPRTLSPLNEFRDDMLVLSGLDHKTAEGGNGDHARAGGTYLTGVRPKETTGTDIQLGISVDQVAAQTIGNQTRFPSLELGCESTRTSGSCDAGYSCVYENCMSWRNATTPNPTEVNPRLLFERLFGNLDSSQSPAEREAARADRKSVLDVVTGRTQSLMGALGAADRRKIDEYFTSIREVEQQIERTNDVKLAIQPEFERPAGIPDKFSVHAKLMHDLIVLAFQGDMTRVATLMYAREGSNSVYDGSGVPDAHHPITHHRNIADLVAKVQMVNQYHVQQFAYLVKRLKSIQEGDGSILDHSMIVYGSSISDGNVHSHRTLPTVMLGRGDGSIKPGRHIHYEDTPMTNFFLTVLDKMGAKAETLGDSTGRVEHLSGV
jgi:hypothetical protein